MVVTRLVCYSRFGDSFAGILENSICTSFHQQEHASGLGLWDITENMGFKPWHLMPPLIGEPRCHQNSCTVLILYIIHR